MQESNLNCQQLEDALDAYYDLELDGEQAEAVEAHLASCSACTARLADIENVVSQIKSLPEVALSRDLSSVIEAKILSQGAQVRETSTSSTAAQGNVVALAPKNQSKSHWYWLASAAAVMALCLSLAQFKPLAAPVQEARAPQAKAVLIADNQLPAVKAGKIAGHSIIANPTDSSTVTLTAAQAKVKLASLKNSSKENVTEKLLAEAGKTGRSADLNQNHVNDKDELVAFYEYENTDNASDIGISTNEDGLYAIKL